jgi:hypothetical protein
VGVRRRSSHTDASFVGEAFIQGAEADFALSGPLHQRTLMVRGSADLEDESELLLARAAVAEVAQQLDELDEVDVLEEVR